MWKNVKNLKKTARADIAGLGSIGLIEVKVLSLHNSLNFGQR